MEVGPGVILLVGLRAAAHQPSAGVTDPAHNPERETRQRCKVSLPPLLVGPALHHFHCRVQQLAILAQRRPVVVNRPVGADERLKPVAEENLRTPYQSPRGQCVGRRDDGGGEGIVSAMGIRPDAVLGMVPPEGGVDEGEAGLDR